MPGASFLSGNLVSGLLAAMAWGGGDFAGGLGVKHAGSSVRGGLRVVLVSHSVSLLALFALVLLEPSQALTPAPVLWGLLAGFFGGVGCMVFYICLASGAMGAAAALSGVLTAAIPAVVSAALEGAPSPLQLLGFAVAIVAIWQIAASPAGSSGTSARTLRLALLAGAAFGLYFVALRMAGAVGPVRAILVSRCGSVSVCALGLVALWLRDRRGQPRSAGPSCGGDSPAAFPVPFLSAAAARWAMASSVLDTTGNLLYVLSTRSGRLDVAAVLASLYPASTILLAAVILRERPTRRQGIGMLLAIGAVVLITL